MLLMHPSTTSFYFTHAY